MLSPVGSRIYGALPNGQSIDACSLAGRDSLVLEVIALSGIATRLLAPGRNGLLDDVVLGLSDLDSYLAGHPYFGAIAGRVNRLEERSTAAAKPGPVNLTYD